MLDLKKQNLHFVQIEKIKKVILPSPRSECRIHHTEGSRGAERPSRRHLHEEPNRRRKGREQRLQEEGHPSFEQGPRLYRPAFPHPAVLM
ncbi:hypothetical protein MTP99_003624 [Tenebrio molitor]|nr:hypothetical protein MTP99_003624 [Tenebrio molitor]